MTCITARIKNGKLYVKTKKTKSCKLQRQSAQKLIDSIPTKRIIIK